MIMPEEKAEMLFEGLKMAVVACDRITELDRCDDCPVHCLEYDSFYEVADCISKETWEKFFDFAEEIEDESESRFYHYWIESETQKEI